MALSITTFAPLDAGANINAGRVFIYRTADAAGTVETSGYFDGVAAKINSGDVVLVVSTNATPFAKFYRLINTAGVITVGTAVAFA